MSNELVNSGQGGAKWSQENQQRLFFSTTNYGIQDGAVRLNNFGKRETIAAKIQTTTAARVLGAILFMRRRA